MRRSWQYKEGQAGHVTITMSDGARTDRLVLNLTPEQVCWFVDNTTMNGGCDDNAINANKNGKLFSRNTIKATADAFRPGVISRASTTMILCPAKPATGEPKLFAEAYQKAASHAEGEKQVRERVGFEYCAARDRSGFT